MQFLIRDKPDKRGERDIAGVDWRFNAWGGLIGGLYKDWREDNMVKILLCASSTHLPESSSFQ